MSVAQLLDGTAVARRSFAETAERAADFAAAQGRSVCLATVLIGDDPASQTYVRMKQRRAAQLGLESRRVRLSAETTTDEAVAAVRALSEDDTVDGILVQHPAPAQVDELAVFEAIAPKKDVDGVTMHSFAAMGLSANGFHSCTPEGIVRLLDAYDVPTAGRRVCVVGRSAILGKPVGLLLLARDATVTFCHSHTTDLAAQVSEADIVVAAVGRPELVRGEWIKPDAVVVDAGYNPGNVGDVEFSRAAARASYITPVPGGVGPMTIAVLMEQTVTAAENRVR
ncbi:bifunctional protein FolD [Flexivirga endophytica]|uniref:Bifunctional protein FolD n=1 Tax=Flexivirga endophytica TaxID=1849103 RepID=A0A916X1N1_9MICO|nr:bifunctional 5,10-methylenetetrahydrofolate dehydrogenase/5,10-methenyltetrahydrofolate cyclohydrolase [Flexivirga endophytica]GGB46735.1 bifunctional protein FolD [Flexivirga endophytica]GHB70789.1 bifunctional protein FolD [Flexivirga endophytica]